MDFPTEKMSPAQIFKNFNTVCISIVKNMSVESVKNLHESLQEFKINTKNDHTMNSLLSPLLDYIALPLLVILRKPDVPWILHEETLLCLCELLQQIECVNVQSFLSIFTVCFIVVADRQNPSNVSSCGEDVKLQALHAVRCLINSSSSAVLQQLYSMQQFRVQLGHAIFLCLKMVQQETNRELRIQALETVCKLGLKDRVTSLSSLQVDVTSCSTDTPKDPENFPRTQSSSSDSLGLLSNTVREVLSSFLPGVCSACARVAAGDEKQGHRLTVAAITTLDHYLCSVLDNDFIWSRVNPSGNSLDGNRVVTLELLQQRLLEKKSGKSESGAAALKDGNKCEEFADQCAVLSPAWLSLVSGRVVGVVRAVCRPLLQHQHPAVRTALARTLGRLLMSCNRSVPGLVVPCVETLAALSVDTHAAVSSAAANSLTAPPAADGILCNSKGSRRDGIFRIEDGGTQAAGGLYPEDCWRKKPPQRLFTILSTDVQRALQDSVCQAIRRLPTVARGADQQLSLSLLRQVHGCLILLGEHNTRRLLSLPGVGVMAIRSLASTCTYDATDDGLLQERTLLQDPLSLAPLPTALGERRLYLRSPQHLPTLRAVCRVMGSSMAPVLTLQMWKETLNTTGHLAAEMMDILAAMMDGLTNAEDDARGEDYESTSKQELVDGVQERFVSSLLEIILTDTMLLSPVKLQSAQSDDSRLDKDPDNGEDIYVCHTSSPNSHVTDKLEHIYSQFHTPFNPCIPHHRDHSTTASTQLVSRSCASPHPTVLYCKRNTLVVANSLRLVASCARLMGPSFAMFFGCVMCPVMERCGGSNVLVAHAAAQALEGVSRSCGYSGGLRQLVEEAVSHYWYPLSMQLKRPEVYPWAVQTLQVCLQCSSDNPVLVQYLHQLLQELLLCLDSRRSLASHQLLALLRLYLATHSKKGRTQVKPKKMKEMEPETTIPKLEANNETAASTEGQDKSPCEDERCGDRSPLGPLALFLQEYHDIHVKTKATFEAEQRSIEEKMNNVLVEELDGDQGLGAREFKEHVKDGEKVKGCRGEGDLEDDSSGHANEGDDTEGDASKDVPADVQLLVSILERCCFLLHTRDREIILILLDTIELGCTALRMWENSHLPVLHKVWKPLLLRIKDRDSVVTLRSLTVLCVMVSSSGDFLRKRCLRELLPVVNNFLLSQSSLSLKKTESSGYFMTAAYLTQKRLLETLYPELVQGLQLSGREMTDVVESCAAYLDVRQPPQLMQASLRMLHTMSASHPHHVWLVLAWLLPPATLVPPATPNDTVASHQQGLRSVTLDGGCGDRTHRPQELMIQLLQKLSHSKPSLA